MMIVVKRAFNFQDLEIYERNMAPFGFPERYEKTFTVKNNFIVKPSTRPQYAPDWIKKDGLFDLAIADGNLKVIP